MSIKQSFSDHISELRLRLLVWFVFFIVGSVIGFLKSNFLLTLLIKPLGEPLFYTSPVGGFNFVMQIAVLFGFLVSLPVLIYEIIKFCQPVLSTNVKKIVPKLVFFSFCLLVISLTIAFYLFIPAAIHFLKGFGGDQIQALITTNEYFSFILIYLIGLAILFQMPVIILLINYISRLSTKQLMKWQKIMIVFSFIVAAILTPTPDPINQTIMAAPIIVLYEISIFLVWTINKNRKPSEETTSKNDKKRSLFSYILIAIIICLAIFLTIFYIRHNQSQKTSSKPDITNQEKTQLDKSAVLIDQNNDVTNVSQDTFQFIVVEKKMITVRQNSNNIFGQTLDQKDEAKIIHSLPEGTEISMLYYDETNNRVLVTSTDNHIFYFSPIDNLTVAEINPPTGETWPNIKSLTTYLNNLYILEDKTGTIWKYASSDGKTFQSRTSYLTNSISSDETAEAIATDGSIYLLFKDGRTNKFLRGEPDKFTLPILPPPNNRWDSPQNIFADKVGDNVYIQDSNKIVEISKLGQYQRQFVLLDKQIRTSYISEKNKMGWVLSGDKIYQFDL